MRKNRAELRKQLGEPLERTRVAAVSAAIAAQLKEQRLATIKALKNVLTGPADMEVETETRTSSRKKTRKIVGSSSDVSTTKESAKSGILKGRFKFAHP